MKKHFLTLSLMAMLTACGGGTNNNTPNDNASQAATNTPPATQEATIKPTEYPNWETNKGIGSVKTITPPLSDSPDAAMAAKGEET